MKMAESYVIKGKSIWKSPNKVWSIEVSEDGKRRFYGNPPIHTLLELAVSDGWHAYFVYIDERGIQRWADMGEYRVPKYVQEKAHSILWKVYRDYKAGKKDYWKVR